ncbi:MAG: histidine phosphatase family protein [Solobacterium sp.]|nr:histidine phosphatase family protein [Solobacterium sp.]
MLYIVRHGQTARNKANVLLGRTDVPLNELGLQQAGITARHFQVAGIVFDRVYSSPLVRALDTARIIAPYAEIRIDDRLIEMDYGEYEGCDLNAPPAEVLAFFRDFVHVPAPDGMEQLPAVTARLGTFLEEICKDAEQKNILLATHAISMKGALEYLTPDSAGRYWSMYIGNCDVWCAEVKDGHYAVPKAWLQSRSPSF